MTISTGLNADVIVNGVGTSMATTNNDVDGVNYCFVSTGWQFSATSTPVTGALPANGLITSLSTTGLTYQLADYSANNVLRINSSTAATLTFASQIPAQNVYVLATSGSGSCVMSAQVNFTDATSQNFTSISVNDWYGGTPYEIGQIGRILRNTTSTTLETATNGPRLYRYTLAISAANQSKQIASIQFTRTSGTGILNIYAVSYETVITCAAPTSPTAGTITPTSAVLNWSQSGTPPQWQIKYGPAGFNPATAGTAVFTPTKPYTLNPPLTASTSYDYYVRAVCGAGDTSLWSPVTSFTTTCNAPAIVTKTDSFRCGPGTVDLAATTVSGASIKWYANLTGGTALATGNTYTTPSISTTTTYYIAAASGTCESSPRQAVIATVRPVPSVNIGNDTTICPGVTYTLDATTANATYAWNTGATTATIDVSAAGTYSVLVTVNECGGSDARVITPGIVPVNNLPVTTNLCDGETASLNAGNTGSSFVWTPGGATTQFINVTAGGTYSVAIKSTDGCVINSNTNVIIRPLPVAVLGNDTSICEGDAIVLDAGNANPGYTYDWNTGANSQTINVSDSGTYTVTVTTPYNCVNTENKHVAFLPSPRVEGFNFVPLFYEELGKVKFSPLNPTSVNTYEWDFGDGSPVSTQTNPLHTYAGSGEFIVTLKVFNNCSEYSISQPINVNLTTGITTLGKDQVAVMLYPNPARNLLTIENKTSQVKMEEVTIFNILGAVVYRHKADNAQQHQLSVSDLSSGIYSVRILTDKGYVTRKFEVIR